MGPADYRDGFERRAAGQPGNTRDLVQRDQRLPAGRHNGICCWGHNIRQLERGCCRGIDGSGGDGDCASQYRHQDRRPGNQPGQGITERFNRSSFVWFE